MIRITTFRVPEDNPSLHDELRRSVEPSPGRFRWIGRRLMDDPAGPEIVVVSVGGGRDEMERTFAGAMAGFSPALRTAIADTGADYYHCRVHGQWPREQATCLIRIFRGRLVQGDERDFDARAAQAYLANFGSNPRCAAVVAGIREGREILLGSLWTSWDAVVSATQGDLRKVLPIQMPPWAVAGSAVHYEIVAARSD